MKLRALVASLALLAGTAVANAADSAWFTMEAPAQGVTSTSGPGQTLVINKDTSAGNPVTLTIGFNISVAEQFGGTGLLSGWAFQLDNITSGGGATVAFGNPNNATAAGSTYDTPFPTDNAGGNGFGAGALDAANTGSPGLVFTFDITIDKSAGPGPIDIFGGFRATFNSTGYAWYGNLGPNAGRYGIAGYNNRAGELPLISINNVPEPATIALLGMGVVALIRRRR